MEKLNDKGKKSVEEKIWGTDTPYYHVGAPSFLRGLRLSFLRFVAPVNPFAKKQVEKGDEITYEPFVGRNFHRTPSLPNPYGFNMKYPFHFDSENDENDMRGKGPLLCNEIANNTTIQFEEVLLPLACERALRKYQLCKTVNGEAKCSNEGDNFLLTCPNFALDMLRKQKLKNKIHQNI